MGSQQKDSVKVAVNIRPLIKEELRDGCTECVTVTPGAPQVKIGPDVFTFDHVYGSMGPSSSLMFDQCVLPLVDSAFNGYNATVLAYGQTGSGKTHTMGTDCGPKSNCGGIIPQVMETIFRKLVATKDGTEFLIRVSFIEIFMEKVFDLLDANQAPRSLVGPAKPSAPARAPIQIRETASGLIFLEGATKIMVSSKDEMANLLARGSSSRATASTNMNRQSSRSHAIFTIFLEQKKKSGMASDKSASSDYDILSSKFHLVDLAGSERSKNTGAEGQRLKEGSKINHGLSILGNVITALCDEKKRAVKAFVPYRDSKLTRLLQDSLGGNSKTVMIACISPADSNAEETTLTLKYANRARNIKNKAVVNRDQETSEIVKLRSQVEQLQSELMVSRSGSAALEELQNKVVMLELKNSELQNELKRKELCCEQLAEQARDSQSELMVSRSGSAALEELENKVVMLELKNSELQNELKKKELCCEQLAEQAHDSQLEMDNLKLKLESALNGKSCDDIENAVNEQDVDLMENYILKTQQLKDELILQKFSTECRNDAPDQLSMENHTEVKGLGYGYQVATFNASEIDEEDKEREHSSMQDKLDQELQELDKRLQQKEAEMIQFAKSESSVIKQHYEKLYELEQGKRSLQEEIENLHHVLTNASPSTDDNVQKLKETYLQKLNALESQVSELKKIQEAQHKSEDAAKCLQEEIHRIKSQKVQLQQKIKQESEQFRSWKTARKKEVPQVLKRKRKTEEAPAALKRQKVEKKKYELRSREKQESSASAAQEGPQATAAAQEGPQATAAAAQEEPEAIEIAGDQTDWQLGEKIDNRHVMCRFCRKTLRGHLTHLRRHLGNCRCFALKLGF